MESVKYVATFLIFFFRTFVASSAASVENLQETAMRASTGRLFLTINLVFVLFFVG